MFREKINLLVTPRLQSLNNSKAAASSAPALDLTKDDDTKVLIITKHGIESRECEAYLWSFCGLMEIRPRCCFFGEMRSDGPKGMLSVVV